MVDRQPGDPLQWLAETKFHPPLLRDDVIPRHHLLHDLYNRMASHPLTLLSSPAGYGKTTLLAALPPTYPDLSVSWLSLDEEDNDPFRFLSALIIALQHLDLDCSATVESLLTGYTRHGVEVRRVTSVLINDVLETLSHPFALILDDLHRIIEPSIFVALDYLLEHRPPQLHLVLATRVDPPLALARLRARGEVAELRMNELRFSEEEAGAFLNERLRLSLSADDLALLHYHTEGWPVGLRLLASSLDHIGSVEDRKFFIQHLAQNDRNIFEFLAEEVYNRQEAEVKAFLLETAILPELTTVLCEAVTRRDSAGTMLEEVYRRNLFLVQVSPSQEQPSLELPVSRFDEPRLGTTSLKLKTRYRYHGLFAEFLRHRAEQKWPERVPDLHLRAAQAEIDPARAVGHYLAAARWPEAANLIEDVGAEMFNRGYLDNLSRWINALPASIREGHPRLLYYLSQCAIWKGRWQEAQSLLERALHGFEAAGDEAGQGEALVNLATCATMQADLKGSFALFDQALTHPILPHNRFQALLGRASLKLAWGDWPQAERDFNAAMALIQQSNELDLLHPITFSFVNPAFAILPGGLEHLEHICNLARAQLSDRLSLLRLMVEAMRAVLHLFRGQLTEVIRTSEKALALRERLGGQPFLGIDPAFLLIGAHTSLGGPSAVDSRFDFPSLGDEQTSQPLPDPAVFLFAIGRCRWLQGRLREAREIYAQMEATKNPRREIPAARVCRAWMYSLLEMAEGRYGEAERALRRPGVLEQTDRYSTIGGSSRLMLARLYWHQHRHREALAELAPVLTYHEQLGIPSPILLEGQSIVPLLRLAVEEGVHEHYAAYLLELLGVESEPRPVHVPDMGATLTPREVEVLSLVMAGHSNRAIAEQLAISEWTVKSHLTKTYRKLDVSSRTQAATRARELGLG